MKTNYDQKLQTDIDQYNFLKKQFFPLMARVAVGKASYFFMNLRNHLNKVLILTYFLITLIVMGYCNIQTEKEYIIVKSTETHYLPDTIKNHKDYLYAIRKYESGNNYKSVNPYGYMGAYQFGQSTLKAIGIGPVKQEVFLNNPKLQDIAMDMLLRENKKYLEKYIGRYNCKTIARIYVTESGILAAAHLVGPERVIRWLETNGKEDYADLNGRKCSQNIKEFSTYKLNL